MQFHKGVIRAAAIALALIIHPVFAAAAEPELFYDAELKLIHEDNVVGFLPQGQGAFPAGVGPVSGRGMPGGAMGMMGPGMPGGHTPQNTGTGLGTAGDTELNLYADLGGSTEIASRTSLFIMGSAEHNSYDTFTDLDSTVGGLSAGISMGLGDMVLTRFAVNGRIKRYGDSDRDSSAYGATLSFKERLTPSFWLKEVYDYEKNNARSAFFSYTGNSLGVWAGLLVAPQTTVFAGYNHLSRDFDEPAGFTMTANTVSAGLEYEFSKRWFLDAQYDHQSSDSNEPGTATTDNIVSAGLRYSY